MYSSGNFPAEAASLSVGALPSREKVHNTPFSIGMWVALLTLKP